MTDTTDEATGHAPGPPQQSVWELLAALHALQANLLLHDTRSQAEGASLLLATEPKDKAILLDALRDAPERVAVGDRLRLQARLDGRRLEFGVTVRRILKLRDGIAYLADQPELLLDMQRRTSYRLRIPPAQEMKAAIAAGNGEIEARLLDISRTGLGAELAPPDIAALPLREGTTVQCRLTLPDIEVDVQATVRHHSASRSTTRVGLEFDELSPAVESALAKSMLRLERLLLRDRRSANARAVWHGGR